MSKEMTPQKTLHLQPAAVEDAACDLQTEKNVESELDSTATINKGLSCDMSIIATTNTQVLSNPLHRALVEP